MIDIHTHILPGIDDGAEQLIDALRMAQAAWDEGITDIIATPHHANGSYMNYAADVQEAVHILQQRLQLENIPLRLHAGQEIRVHDGLLDALDRKRVAYARPIRLYAYRIAQQHVPKDMLSLIHELTLLGIRPIIAHPERNRAIVDDPRLLAELIEHGAFSQVTTSSLLGSFGDRVRKARSLCRNGFIHIVSSDAHHITRRGFHMRAAYAKIAEELGVRVGCLL